MEIVRICSTPTTTIKLSETILTLFLRINITILKHIAYICSGNTIIHITHKEIFISYKLMTWIKIAPWSHRKIFAS